MGVSELKELAEQIIPRKYLRVWGMSALRAYSLTLKGDKRNCPCCNKSFSKFMSYGVIARKEVLCPWCLSLERHRLLWLYLEQKTNIYTDNLKVLHFAPEHQFQERLKAATNVDYISADIDMPTAMVKEDITAISFDDNSFDVIICNHVLEHITEDIKAMSELYRVLKPGGWAILQTPVNNNADTDEDHSVTDPKERETRFGQNDHVRIYGKADKAARLASVGFNVVMDDMVMQMPKDLVDKHRLDITEYIFRVEKT